MYAIVDIETTGGSAGNEKITEIAIITHDGKKIVDRYSTLLNPEKPIPEFIQRFTGITDYMVQNQPKFYEVAKEILELMEGKIFVAHNVNFDYSFVKREFESLGFGFKKDTLCTVKLSRKIIPGFPSYSLGKLCNSLGIGLENRHRALGDALATAELFTLLKEKDENNIFEQFLNPISKIRKKNIQEFSFPINHLPVTAGIYYFCDFNNEIIYVGKSKNIRARVTNHLSNTKTKKAVELLKNTKEIKCQETGSEEFALILESIEISSIRPRFNVAGKKPGKNIYLVKNKSKEGYYSSKLKFIIEENDEVLKGFNSVKEAEIFLELNKKKFVLCGKYMGENLGTKKCFNRQLNSCLGACEGVELQETYNKRFDLFLEQFKFTKDDFILIFDAENTEENYLVRAGNHKKVGIKKYSKEFLNNTVEWGNLVELKEMYNHTYHILKHIVDKKKYQKMIEINSPFRLFS
jgi:DNA polymerase III subunit epsilon